MSGLLTMLDEGRIIRGKWSRIDDGDQMLCLYTALAGDANARPETCPASLMPEWLAHLLPWMDDAGTLDHWPDVVRRVARLAPGFNSLPPEVEWSVRALAVREAMLHTSESGLLSICERVAILCELRGRGEVVDDTGFAAELERVWGKTRVSWPAGAAAVAVAAGAALSAVAVAAGAAGAALSAARAAASAAAAGSKAGRTAVSKAADRLIDAILDEIERRVLEGR